MNANISDYFRQKALDKDRSEFLLGFADIANIVNPISECIPYTKAVSFGVVLDPAVVSQLSGGRSRAYCDEVSKIDAILMEFGEDLKFYLGKIGHQSMTLGEAQGVLEDAGLKHDDVPLFKHNVIAANAGLGWIGKCGLVVTKPYGSAIRLNTLLTNAPFTCCEQAFLSRCGRCDECLEVCPKNLGGDDGPIADMLYEDIFSDDTPWMGWNRRAMEKWCDETEICGLCVYSCPYTKAYLNRRGLS